MLVSVKQGWELGEADVTPERLYVNRRSFMAGAAATLALAPRAAVGAAGAVGQTVSSSAFSTDEEPTSIESITRYNNFYEFGTDKNDLARHAAALTTSPWTIAVEGHCNKPGIYDLDELMKNQPLEERIYRLRCVETWSMVIPWLGFPLADWINRFEPTSKAKYVQFDTLYRPSEMRGQRRRRGTLKWPYQEGLRMDEAMHPLTIMAVGLYGKKLPNQNGAPVRLVVPWKYGFKSIKSVVTIRFTKRRPKTTWNEEGPREYGFYSNVNPNVDHRRWSQAKERRIGEWRRRKTLMFNGYGDEVASLYTGMDLRKKLLMKVRRKILRHSAAKPVAILLGLLPLTWLAWQFPDGLGANPIEALNRATGDWALRLLILTLAISPLAKLTGTSDLLRFRRIAGLFVFGYAFLHLSSYVGLDQFFAWGAIWEDIVKRNFITIGMLTFALLVPLAATSTDGMIRRLGGRQWRLLHRLIYPAGLLGVLHFFMMVKADATEPLIYAGILLILLGHRLKQRAERRQSGKSTTRAHA